MILAAVSKLGPLEVMGPLSASGNRDLARLLP
jgi:hypothetical protein